jgi:hypothetical protein
MIYRTWGEHSNHYATDAVIIEGQRYIYTYKYGNFAKYYTFEPVESYEFCIVLHH